MGDVMAIIAVRWARRCASCARYGPHAPANCGTDAGAAATPRDRTNYSAGAGAD